MHFQISNILKHIYVEWINNLQISKILERKICIGERVHLQNEHFGI